MNTELATSSSCYEAFINNVAVAFFSVIPYPSNTKEDRKLGKPCYRGHRLVVLPDFQGISLGNKLSEYIANYYHNKGFSFYISSSIPSLISARIRSGKWILCRKGRIASSTGNIQTQTQCRFTASFKYIGEKTK